MREEAQNEEATSEFEEPITVVIPRISTRDLVTLDPDGHYARAKGIDS